ncbi:unnamed protein product [Brassica oleracea var. botrytis]
MVYVMKIEKAPLDSYADIGGIEAQSHEIKEAVELPLTHPQLYAHIGIKPSKGVIFYGERGTGKTVIAKMTEPWKLEDGQPPCHLQMELQNRDIFSGFPTTRTLTLGGATALRALPCSATICLSSDVQHDMMFYYKASRFFTNQKSSFHILEHFIRICSYINFSQPRDKQSSSSIAIPSRAWVDLSVPRSFKKMVWSGPNTASEASYTRETKFIRPYY